MAERNEYWFVADVHLAQPVTDEPERERRFIHQVLREQNLQL